MNKKLKLFLILSTVLFAVTSVSAQNIDAVLGSKDSSSSFNISNSEGDKLFGLGSNGLVNFWNLFRVNGNNFLLHLDGRVGERFSGKHVWIYSGGNIVLSTPHHPAGFVTGGKIEIFSGNEGGGINILGGSEDDGFGEYGVINIQPGDNNDLNLYGGAHGSQNGLTGGDVNIEASKGGTSGDVNIKSGEGDSYNAGNINLTGGNTLEGEGGSIVITTGIATSLYEPGEDGKLILNGSGTYSGSWTQASDKRFKKNIQSINNPTEKFIQLEPVTYELRKEQFPDKHFEVGEQIGLIAKDVEKLFPQLVKSDHDGYKTVDYTKLSVLAIEAIKAQNERVSALEEKIENLELMLSNQKNLIEQVQYLLEKEKQNIKSTKL